MLFRLKTPIIMLIQSLCFPVFLNRAVCITLLRLGLLACFFGTFSYFALFSSMKKRDISLNFEELCNSKIRGVNLGGWLVLEPWITPKIFENANKDYKVKNGIIDEYTFHKYVPRDQVAKQMEK